MWSKKQKILKKIIPLTILFIISLNSLLVFIPTSYNQLKTEKYTNLRISGERRYSEQWIDNPTFSSLESWVPIEQGDPSDFDAEISNGQGNYILLGEERTFSEISGTPKENDWKNVTNPAFPAPPDFNEINEYGCEVNHTWIDPDDPIQSPSVHWVRNITMPVNMSDYAITSVSISAIFNASVTTDSGNNADGFPFIHPGIDTELDFPAQQGDYDSVRFYVQISDLERNEVHEVAWYQTVDLGQESPEINNITDSFMEKKTTEALKYYLTSLFERDNYHFQITLGIRIKCVDNYNYDTDRWDSLRIKSCNLSFTYQKKMNQFGALSWNQVGRKISNSSDILVTGANFTFKYKIDQSWPYLLSPNSEIRVLINNKQLNETIKLSSAPTSFQLAKPTGFDVFSLISKGINISVSIQVFLADYFLLDHPIVISIDDVYLDISLVLIYEDILTEPELFRILFIIASIAAVCLGGYLYAYQKILKYPRPVRKVRKYRFSLRKTKSPNINITDRKTAFNLAYKRIISPTNKYIRGKPSELKPESKKLMKEKEIEQKKQKLEEVG